MYFRFRLSVVLNVFVSSQFLLPVFLARIRDLAPPYVLQESDSFEHVHLLWCEPRYDDKDSSLASDQQITSCNILLTRRLSLFCFTCECWQLAESSIVERYSGAAN